MLKAECDRCHTLTAPEKSGALSLVGLDDEQTRDELGLLCDECASELRSWIDAGKPEAKEPLP